jgi:hypothetical protein
VVLAVMVLSVMVLEVMVLAVMACWPGICIRVGQLLTR